MSTAIVEKKQASPSRPLPNVRQLYERWLQSSRSRLRRRRPTPVALLVGVLVFSGLQAGLVLYNSWQQGGHPDPIFQPRLERLQAQLSAFPDRPALVFLGSSRVMCGFDLKGCEQTSIDQGHPLIAASLDHPGGGSISAMIMWQRLVRRQIRPQRVLVELLPPLLGQRDFPDELEEWRLPTYRLEHEDLPWVRRYAGANRPDLEEDWWLGNFFPWYGQRFELVNDVVPNLLPLNKRTFPKLAFIECVAEQSPHGLPSPERRERGTLIAHKEYEPRLRKYKIEGAAAQATEDLLQSCKQNGIKATLLLMPESPVFQSWYPPEALQELNRFIGTLQAKYAVNLIDARSWFADEESFFDGHHLLPAAAQTFTRRLTQEHLLPELRKTQLRQISDAGP